MEPAGQANSYSSKPAQVVLREKLSAILAEARPALTHEPGRAAEQGDYSIPVPSIKGRLKYQGNVDELVSEWIKSAEAHPEIISKAYLLDAGKMSFLCFQLNKAMFTRLVLESVVSQGDKYGYSDSLAGQRIVIEYSSPNIAKPFHAGHLRSTIIGNVLKNIHIAMGAEVVGINYLGDWGKQYGLLAVGYEKYGDEEQFKENAFMHLFDIYVRINEDLDNDPAIEEQARYIDNLLSRFIVPLIISIYFKRMEDGDEAALKLWQRFRNISIEEYERVYRRLNVKFDVYDGEALQQEGMVEACKVLEEKGLLQDSEGAQIIDLSMANAIIKNRLGATLYITRDISAAKARYEKYHFDKMIYVVAAPQNLHFQQLFKILELMGYDWASKCTHVNYGMVKLPKSDDGKEQNMSTRKGKVIFLAETLDKARDTVHAKMLEDAKGKLSEITEKLGKDPLEHSDVIGLSSVVIQDLSAKRIKDYEMHISRITSTQGFTGPYLQFAHARLCSMRDHNSEVKISTDIDYNILTGSEVDAIISQLSKWPETVAAAGKTLEPCTIVSYLFDLAQAVRIRSPNCVLIIQLSASYKALYIQNQPREIQEARMLLFDCCRIVLSNGLHMLGLTPVERM